MRNEPATRRAPLAFHAMTKPIGPICNLDCRYCFYLEKEDLQRAEGRAGNGSWQMSDGLLESYIRQYIEGQDAPEIQFAWQGGEPTLLGVRFFRRVLEIQRHFAAGKRITNALQTNGTLLDDEWGAFLAENGFLVGLSIDGPRELHDAYRVDKNGQPTFDAVSRGLDVLKKHGVEFNTLTVVNDLNSQRPLEVYRFLKQAGSGFMQFIPLVERAASAPLETPGGLIQLSLAPPPKSRNDASAVTEWSVRPSDWGAFQIAIFDEWVRKDVGRVFVQSFDVALGIWAGVGSSLCVFSKTCGKGVAVEHNGDVYSCDHYVYPEYRLGNIADTPLAEMVVSRRQEAFGNAKSGSLPRYCRRCDVRFACNGECPKHRFYRTPDGEYGLNYLCAGYKKFFKHIDPYMRTMVSLLEAERPPAEIMRMIASQERGKSSLQ